MCRSIFGVVLLIAFGSIDVSTQVPTLRSRVKALGQDVTREYRPNYPEPDFPTLVAESDTIVVGTIDHGVPVLTNEDSMLQTDYYFTVQRVIKRSASRPIVSGEKLVARRLGGVTTLDGFNVSTTEVGFPRFNSGETYVLFLTREPNEAHLTFRYGGQNAFVVKADNTVSQVSTNNLGTWNRDRGLVGLPAFLNEIQEIIAAPR